MSPSLLIRRLGAVALFCFCVSPAAAQELDWAQKMFSELKIDFGTVARGADTRHELVIENIYKEDVTITDVRTTCGCSAANPDRTKLKTHEQATVEVVMNTTDFMRRKDSNVLVTITFEGGGQKTVRVPITAYIRPDVVLEPGYVNFTGVYYGDESTRKIKIAYAGRNDWRIGDIRANNPLITPNLRELSRGNGRVEYELLVQLDPKTPIGSFRDQLVMVTNDRSNPEVPVLVEGIVKPDIVITPQTLPLGKLKPGAEKTLSVVVKGNRPFVIENIECDSNRECFKTKFTSDMKDTHVLPLTVVAPDEPGELTEVFTVTIDGRAEPLTFRAQGIIVAN